MSEIKLTSQTFDQEVLLSDKAVLIDFWAPWCVPCQMLSPIIAEIAEEHPEIKVCKVNVDEETELAQSFQVVSIPTVVVLKDGKVKKRAVGFRAKKQLVELFM